MILPNGPNSDDKRHSSKDVPVSVPVNRADSSSSGPAYSSSHMTYPPGGSSGFHSPGPSSPTFPQSTNPADLPPPYQDVAQQLKPTNYVAISRSNDGVKGKYVLDPTVHIPDALLPPLGWFQTERKNMLLESQNGCVETDVTIPNVRYRGKVTMVLRSQNGHVIGKIHRPEGPPLSLSASSKNGYVTVHLPRSFYGPITATSKQGNVKLSRSLQMQQTSFSDVNGTLKCFIGDASPFLRQEGKDWEGDEAVFECKNGNIRVQYDDEPDESPAAAIKGFFSSLFS